MIIQWDYGGGGDGGGGDGSVVGGCNIDCSSSTSKHHTIKNETSQTDKDSPLFLSNLTVNLKDDRFKIKALEHVHNNLVEEYGSIANRSTDDEIQRIKKKCDSDRFDESLDGFDSDGHDDSFSYQRLYRKGRHPPFLVDVFRTMHPGQQDAFTVWNTKERARETNYGTRIDYILVTGDLFAKGCFERCAIRPDVYGSDHCPVECSLELDFKRSFTVPSSCAIFMPELSGKQQKIKSYFTAQSKRSLPSDEDNNTRRNVKRAKTTSLKQRSESLLSYFGSSSSSKNDCDEKKMIVENNSDQHKQQQKNSHLDLHFEQIKQRASTSSKNIINNAESNATWKGLFKGPEPSPLCSGHKEKCILQTVKKEGPNIGRQFYCCNRPSGHSTNKEARCKYFKWKATK